MEYQRSALMEVFERLYRREFFFSVCSYGCNEFPVYCLIDISVWILNLYFRLTEVAHIITSPVSYFHHFPFTLPISLSILVNGMTLHLVTQTINMAVILEFSSQNFLGSLYFTYSQF